MPPASDFVRLAPELRDYLTTLKFRKWSVIGTSVLVVALATVLAFAQRPAYTSQTQVLVELPRTASTQLGQDTGPDMETERALATSTTVAALAAERLDVEPPGDDLLARVSVAVPADTQILEFTFTADEASAARDGAKAFAAAYLESRDERLRRSVAALAAPIEAELETLREALDDIRALAARTDDPDRSLELEDTADTLITQIALLEQRARDIAPLRMLPVGEVVDVAEVPKAPSNRRLFPTVPIALAVGLILGIAAALIRERLDDRFRSENEIEARSGARTLATIPPVEMSRSASLAVNGSTSGAALSDAFRSLRTSLLFAVGGGDTKVVLVTSPEAGDGKTTVVAQLGASLARAGDRVVVVAADLRRPALTDLFGVRSEGGLAPALRGEADASSMVLPTNIANLSVLPTGRVKPDDVEQLRPDRLLEVFDELRLNHEFVLVDAPPVFGVPDTLALAAAADAALLVVDAKKATKSSIDRAMRQLSLVDALVLGEVLNNFTPSDFRAYAPTDDAVGRSPARKRATPGTFGRENVG